MRAVLLFVLALPLALYIRPLRHDWRRAVVLFACVLAGAVLGALVAYPLQPHLPDLDALNLCGTIGVVAGIFGGRFIALRMPGGKQGA